MLFTEIQECPCRAVDALRDMSSINGPDLPGRRAHPPPESAGTSGSQVEARRAFRTFSPNPAGCVVSPMCPPGKCWSSVPRRSARKAADR